MMEAHLILLFDGTGLSEGDKTLSNSRKIFHCLNDASLPSDRIQNVQYYSGLGTSESTFFHRTLSQVRGYGAHDRLFQGYRDLCEFANEHRDKPLKVSIEGFSRGFVIGLVLEKMVHKLGIVDFEEVARQKGVTALSEKEKVAFIAEAYEEVYLSESKPSSPELQTFRDMYSFPQLPEFHLFAFDPVAAFSNHPTLRPFRAVKDADGEVHVTHGPKLPRSTKSYTELISLHEQRTAYELLQVDFPPHYDIERTTLYFEGDHTAVGGGSGLREPLADVAGLEMLHQMQEKAGVIINEQTRERIFEPDPTICLDNEFGGFQFLREDFFYAVTRTVLKLKSRELEPATAQLHPSVIERQKMVSSGGYVLEA